SLSRGVASSRWLRRSRHLLCHLRLSDQLSTASRGGADRHDFTLVFLRSQGQATAPCDVRRPARQPGMYLGPGTRCPEEHLCSRFSIRGWLHREPPLRGARCGLPRGRRRSLTGSAFLVFVGRGTVLFLLATADSRRSLACPADAQTDRN